MSESHRCHVFTLIDPPGLYDPAPNGYSHVASVGGAGRWVFVAGQGGETADGALSPDFRTQVRQALANLVRALSAAGAGSADVVKLTVLIVDHSQARLHLFGSELEAAFAGHRPACTLIPVPRLALDGMLFEIEAVAAVAGGASGRQVAMVHDDVAAVDEDHPVARRFVAVDEPGLAHVER